MKKKILISVVLIIQISLILVFINERETISINQNKIPNNDEILLNSSVWDSEGSIVCNYSGTQSEQQICGDGFGGAIIVWRDERGPNSDIYAQRIDHAGRAQWNGTSGVVICKANYDQTKPQICPDGMGGAIITWQELRPSSNYDIYAQRVNSSGDLQWTPSDGVPICNFGENQRDPQICSDGSFGAIITWRDERFDADIYAQRINSSGDAQWIKNGTIVNSYSINPKTFHQICSDNSHGAIITWEDDRDILTTRTDIYVERINSSGDCVWNGTEGILICNADFEQKFPQLCSDRSGGVIITWQNPNALGYYDIFVQKVNSTGSILWGTNGKAVCQADKSQRYPQITSDGSGGAIITWQDERLDADIYAHRINSTGALWSTLNGITICTESNEQTVPQICSDNLGGAIISWQDNRVDSNGDIYMQKINSTGGIQWNKDGVEVCTRDSAQTIPQICNVSLGCAIITWQDERDDLGDIYAKGTDRVPPSQFSIYSPVKTVNDQTPTVICLFYETISGLDNASVQYAFSIRGSPTPTNWAPVEGVYNDPTCTDPVKEGKRGCFYAKVRAVPFDQDSDTLNTIRFRAKDSLGNLGTQNIAFTISIRSSIVVPSDDNDDAKVYYIPLIITIGISIGIIATAIIIHGFLMKKRPIIQSPVPSK